MIPGSVELRVFDIIDTMKFLIGGIEQNLKVTSYVIESDHDNPTMMHLFYCWKCGKSLFQFSGDVVMSMPGPIFTPVPIVIKCRNCDQRHLINSIM